jgi:prepilin-type N-terminal cleavage/methylation domain-containing protein
VDRLNNTSGFTLMELVIVIVVMGIIATVALRSMEAPIANARFESTRAEMDQLATAIVGNPALYSNGVRTDFGYVGDNGAMPPDLDALNTNPGLGTWNGPYIAGAFSEASDDFKRDAWGTSYSYSGGVTIRSTGGSPNTLTRQFANSTSDLLANSVEVYLTDGAGNPPGDSASSVQVTLSYPNGAGGTKDSILASNTSGRAIFSSTVPIGNHPVEAIYTATDDTVAAVVSVLPGGTSYVTLRFPGALWAADVGGGGGGGSSGDIEYVSGSANVGGADDNNVEFYIENTGSSNVTIDWVVLTYSHSPTAYFEELTCDGQQFDSWNPRAASGDTITFSSPVTLSASQSEKVEVEPFVDKQNGMGNVDPVDMRNVDITVTFSDGSVVTFNTGS